MVALRAVQHDVLQAASVAEAVAILEDLAVAIDVVVTDLGLPDGSGARVMLHCRILRPWVPVLFVTGWGADFPAALSDVAEWRILAKPFRPGHLIEAVRRALEESGDGVVD